MKCSVSFLYDIIINFRKLFSDYLQPLNQNTDIVRAGLIPVNLLDLNLLNTGDRK